ncbi:hypothetical protein CMO90_01345 [Candidatus Woesearchaeota archaeon]|nr:hypothetical protein [Candidatus Woesearchaeota archaeon]|tara:strand:- start:2415 stop:3329 length:915 start_codon:yes stop_codon:yes gene_type:complete
MMKKIARHIIINYVPNILREVITNYRYPQPVKYPVIKHLWSFRDLYLFKRQVECSYTDRNILVISPHPDDEVIGMGATIVKHLNNGSNITVLYMTDGRNGGDPNLTHKQVIKMRHREAMLVGEKYGFKQIYWQLSDTLGKRVFNSEEFFTNRNEVVNNLVDVLDKGQYDSIFLPSFFDWHVDHFTSNKILVDALKKTSIPKLTIYGYEVWSYIPFPNYVVDISDEFLAKKEMLTCYTSQVENGYFQKYIQDRGNLRFQLHLDKRRLGFAEAFLRFDKDVYTELFNDYLIKMINEDVNIYGNIVT